MTMSPGSPDQFDPFLLDPFLLAMESSETLMKARGQGFNRVIPDQVGKLDTGSRACTTLLSQEFRALRVTGSESLSGASIPAVISSTAAAANSLAADSEPATSPNFFRREIDPRSDWWRLLFKLKTKP